jgi:hypothetical protein
VKKCERGVREEREISERMEGIVRLRSYIRTHLGVIFERWSGRNLYYGFDYT